MARIDSHAIFTFVLQEYLYTGIKCFNKTGHESFIHIDDARNAITGIFIIGYMKVNTNGCCSWMFTHSVMNDIRQSM